MTNSKQPIYDVIISGGGPVGLFLACELALAKCSVLILEKAEHPHSPLKRIPFGIRGLSATSIENLDRRGLLPELEIHKNLKNPHQNSGQAPRQQGGHFAGIPFLDADIDASQWKYRLPGSTATSLISTMEEVETILARRAENLGVAIRRGYAVADFQSTADGVTVEAGDQSFAAQWLVACDGARSLIRKRQGFEFAGTEPEFTGYSAAVDIADSSKLKPGRNVTSTGMYMQSQPGYLIIQDFDGGAFHGSEKPITREHIQEVLRRVSETDTTITTLHTATTWTDRARHATSYQKGRILLAGDAAHIHAPLGGQGLNLGLGDAMNLGWKLAATIQNKAPEGLLDSYQIERHPIGEQVLAWSRAQVAVMKPSPEGRALKAIFSDLIRTRDGATYFAGRVWGLFTHYDFGNQHELAGYSAPNFTFEDGTTLSSYMRGAHGLLLDFSGTPSLQALANEYKDLQYLACRAEKNFSLRAVLVRPDGIVAWASENAPDRESAEQAVARWFGRSSSKREHG